MVVTPVARKPIDQFLLSTCTLEARQEVQVLSRISERIVELKVEEGDVVKDGQVLALLDETERELTEREAKVRVVNAKATLERVQGMFKDSIVSQEQLEDAQVAYETGEVQHENAQLMLSYTTIRSPIDGVVVKRHADVGQHVKTNEELFTVANYDPIWGRIHVPERNLNKIQVGMPVKVKVESLPEKEFVGKVNLISPVVDADSGTIKVTFEVPEPLRNNLRPGMFASTHLITETKDNARVLPKKALIIESDTNEVFVVKSYLAAKVSTDYASLLKSGAKVTIVATPKGEPKPQGKHGGPPSRGHRPRTSEAGGAAAKPGMAAHERPVPRTEQELAGGKRAQRSSEAPASLRDGQKTKLTAFASSLRRTDAAGAEGGPKQGKALPHESRSEGSRPAGGPPARVTLESSFHSVPEAAEDDKEIECLLTLPDRHELTDSMEIELKVPADTADAKDGEKAKRVTVRTNSFKLRQLAMKRSVKVGFSEGNEIEVISGVEPGELVVTIGNEDLKQGSIVTITGTEAQGAIQMVKKPKTQKPVEEEAPSWFPMMKERVLATPKVKEEYDKWLAKDPTLATSYTKFRAFCDEMRKKGVLKSRRRSGGR